MSKYLIKEETLVELADVLRKYNEYRDASINLVSNRSAVTLASLPEGVTSIGSNAFRSCTGLTTLTFKGTPTSIVSNTFSGCTNLTIINVPWAEGAVANAPWGATNATINYNYTEG